MKTVSITAQQLKDYIQSGNLPSGVSLDDVVCVPTGQCYQADPRALYGLASPDSAGQFPFTGTGDVNPLFTGVIPGGTIIPDGGGIGTNTGNGGSKNGDPTGPPGDGTKIDASVYGPCGNRASVDTILSSFSWVDYDGQVTRPAGVQLGNDLVLYFEGRIDSSGNCSPYRNVGSSTCDFKKVTITGYYDCPTTGSSNPDCVGGTPGDSNCGNVGTDTGQTGAGKPPEYNKPNCDCIKDAMAAIADAIKAIKDAMTHKAFEACDSIDKCTDRIINSINRKYAYIKKTCQQCKDEVKGGLANTLEHVLTCAQYNITNCEKQPSDYKPDKPKEDKPKQQYTGWCNSNDGIVVVLAAGDPPPGPDYTEVSSGDDFAAVQSASYSACKPDDEPVRPDDKPPVSYPRFSTIDCNLVQYQSSSAIRDLLVALPAVDMMNAATTVAVNVLNDQFGALNPGGPAFALAKALGAMLITPGEIAAKIGADLASAVGCQNTVVGEVYQALASIGYTAKFTGVNLLDYTPRFSYGLNALCRQRQLSPDEALAGFLANVVNEQDLDTHFAIAGLCDTARKVKILASRAKPVPIQLAMMRRRNMIDFEGYQSGMRQLGYLDGNVSEQLFNLSEQRPGISDLMRYMVRDTGDESLVHQFGMDDLFNQKYTGELRQWARDQGIPDEIAKHTWRAHWTIPSPTQLFVFLQRLRNNPKFGGADKLLKDVKDALTQQDILPFWQDHYIETAYRPLTVRDIRRAFGLGVMKEDGLLNAIKQLGYNDANAENLRKFYIKLRDDAAANHKAIRLWLKMAIDRPEAYRRMTAEGLPEDVANQALLDAEVSFVRSPPVKALISGKSDFDTLKAELSAIGVSLDGIERIFAIVGPDIQDKQTVADYQIGLITADAAADRMVNAGIPRTIAARELSDADRSFARSSLLECLSGLRKRYILGEFIRDKARSLVKQRGIVDSRANAIVDSWDCHISANGNQPAISTLCRWLDRGVINATEFKKRLKVLQYDDVTADMIVSDCLQSISDKRAKQQQKAMQDQQKAQEKAQRDMNRAAAAEQRAMKQLAAARKQAAIVRQRRDRQLISFSEKVKAKGNIVLGDAFLFGKQQYVTVQNTYGLSPDEILQNMILSVEDWDGETLDSLANVIDFMAQNAASSGLEPVTI